jgi:hypothetical protein
MDLGCVLEPRGVDSTLFEIPSRNCLESSLSEFSTLLICDCCECIVFWIVEAFYTER